VSVYVDPDSGTSSNILSLAVSDRCALVGLAVGLGAEVSDDRVRC
jgi:hypothetical protein